MGFTSAEPATAGGLREHLAAPPATGDAEVDRVIAGFASGDKATIESLLQFTKIKCVATLPSPSTGAPPLCPAGTADGTEVDAFLAGNCEPTWVLKGQHAQILDVIVGRSQSSPDLFAVTYAKPEEFGWPPTQYTVIYGRAGDANTTWYAGVDQGIPYVFSGCGQTPETIADRRDRTQPNDGYLLAPVSSPAPAPPATGEGLATNNGETNWAPMVGAFLAGAAAVVAIGAGRRRLARHPKQG